jgi:hypothetical protein
MTQATNTTLGEIVLAGDLFGNDGTAPVLRASGVTPGSYSVLQRMSVDSKGRITSIGTALANDVLSIITDATPSAKGIIQVGNQLEVSSGVISVATASSTTKGIAAWGSQFALDAGNVSSALPDAVSVSTKGLVQIGTALSVSGGSTSMDLATSATPGRVSIGSGFLKNQSAGVLAVDSARLVSSVYPNDEPGVCRPGTNMAVDGAGTLTATFPDATGAVKGLVQVGSGLSVTGGVVSYVGGADATTGSLGIVQVGAGLGVASGVLSILDAGTTSKGLVQIGSGLAVSSGTVSLTAPDATTSTKGFVQIGSGLTIFAGFVGLDLPDATTSSAGQVIGFSGTGVDVDAGVMSVSQVASTVSKGLLSPGTGLDVIGSELSLSIASTTKKGIMKVGSGLVDSAGLVSVDPSYMRLNTSYVRTFNERPGIPQALIGTHSGAGWNGYENTVSNAAQHLIELNNQSSNVTLVLADTSGGNPVSGTVFRIVVTHAFTSALNITLRNFSGTQYDIRGATVGAVKPFAQFTASDGTTTRTWTTLPVTSGTGVDVFEINVIRDLAIALVTTITGY